MRVYVIRQVNQTVYHIIYMYDQIIMKTIPEQRPINEWKSYWRTKKPAKQDNLAKAKVKIEAKKILSRENERKAK